MQAKEVSFAIQTRKRDEEEGRAATILSQ